MQSNLQLRVQPLSELATSTGRRRCSFFIGLTILTLILFPIGCRPSSSESDVPDPALVEAPKVSTVPLRIWIAAPIDQPDLLIRQWLSDSEQPIEVTSVSEAELLQRSDMPADVLISPTRLLGELLHREWIVKLPERLTPDRRTSAQSNETADVPDAPAAEIPAGLKTATSYSAVQYGLPLGHSMIHLIGSASVTDQETSWQSLAERLKQAQPSPIQVDAALVDANALVDRFLAIAFGVSPVNAKYGVLFEIRTMKARLTASEFLFAAELLHAMAAQPSASGGQAAAGIVGSHADAWRWVNGSDQPAFALISVSGLDLESRALESAQWIPLTDSRSWNDGSGLMISMASQCRQTSQSIRFIEWMSSDRTLSNLKGSIPGLIPLASQGTTLADRISQQSLQNFRDLNLVCEPRLPRSHDYRRSLAARLLSMLRGEMNATEAMSAAASDWDQITDGVRKEQQAEYEKSLGLNL
jgi:hypothetical protein